MLVRTLLALHPIHPEHAGLSPLLFGAAAVFVVVAAALLWRAPRATPTLDRPVDSWVGGLTPGQGAARVIAVGATALAVAAGRLGIEVELENVAPALVVGFAWPALLFASAAGGPVWRWVDPWDAIARTVDRSDAEPSADVRPALLATLAWTWYLAVYLDALSPRSVGLALGIYTVVMVGGALAVGRVAWLSRVDVFGLVFGWLARLPRGGLSSWVPPRGAELVLGALAGGLAFGAVRTSELWGELNVVPGAGLYATGAMVGAAVAVAGVLWLLERWARREGSTGSVVVASLPAATSIALVVALARSRLFTSLQLLPSLLADPFDAEVGGILAPLQPVSLAAVQLLVLLMGCVAGAAALGRRIERTGRRPAIVALVVLTVLGITAISVAPGL